MDVVLDPGKCDGSLPAALTEPEQERPGTLVAQQSLLPLLTKESHDATAHFIRTKVVSLNLSSWEGRGGVRTTLTRRSTETAGAV